MRAAWIALLLPLAGCGGQPEAEQAGPAPAAEAGEAPLAWTGRFAATPALCRGGVWDLGEERIVTDGETHCVVNRAERRGDTMALDLACTAEGMESGERWGVTPTERGVRVSRAIPGEERIDVDLLRCD